MPSKKFFQSNDKLPQFLSFDFSEYQIYPKFQNNNLSFYDYYLALANIIPHNFESYAICLHPIGYYQNEQYIEPKINNRKSIFKAFEISVNDEINLDYLCDLESELFQKYSSLLYTSNGDCSDVQFNFMINTLKNLVDNEIYYYYELLKIISYSEYDYSKISELLFKGEILTHQELQQHSKISTQPTILFDDSEKWVIATDYDTPYTFIGGEKYFVEKFLNSEYDIYPITPKYQWVKKYD
ncbi:hypothetical protein LU290_08960 [Moraxella nasibovis]|uniref:hypothetical protein n=1 Tax=Moraxella nasibovis TaxID=2904120 RepID=UPI0024108FB5|nr:hypothetical protein [Moraxella nasibovis]WFF38366.1 hypothetical protein LU290_08960 [Moraxella nasibovis]